MKAYTKPTGIIAAILAALIICVSASLYQAGLISEDFYLRLVSAVEGETITESYDLEVHYIDVGQGESILIKAPYGNILIDCGEIDLGNTVTNYLHTNGVYSLDMFIATHPHSDHIGCAEHIIKTFPVTEVIMPKIPKEYLPTTSFYQDFLVAAKESECKVTYAKVGKTFDLGSGAELKILSPSGDMGDNLNNYSVAAKLTFGEVSFLFTGDMEKTAEEAVLSSGADISCTVYSAGHHGSTTSNSSAFLDAAAPEYAVVSCGRNNDYGHPHREIISAFKKRKIKFYRTDYDGSVVFGTDGTELFISTENGDD